MILSLKCMDNVKINRNLSVNQHVEWIKITNEDLERQATSPVSTFFPCVFQVIYNLSMGAPTWDPLHMLSVDWMTESWLPWDRVIHQANTVPARYFWTMAKFCAKVLRPSWTSCIVVLFNVLCSSFIYWIY